MKALIEKLSGKKTYLVALVLVIVSGLQAQGYITAETYKTVEGILIGLGLMTLRAGVTKSG